MKTKTVVQGMILIGACIAITPAQAHPNHYDEWPGYGLIQFTLFGHYPHNHHSHKHHYYGDHKPYYERPRQYSYGYQRRHKHQHKHHGRRSHGHDGRRR